MSLYQKLKFENSNNIEALEKIEKAAAEAIDYAAQYYEYAVDNTEVNNDGLISLTFHPGQNIEDEAEVVRSQFDSSQTKTLIMNTQKANEIAQKVAAIDARVAAIVEEEGGEIFLRGSFKAKKGTNYKYNLTTGTWVYNNEGYHVENAITSALNA